MAASSQLSFDYLKFIVRKLGRACSKTYLYNLCAWSARLRAAFEACVKL
jgi:hypothetical protein